MKHWHSASVTVRAAVQTLNLLVTVYNQVIVSDGIESPAGLSVDWLTDKLYWTEAVRGHIEVSNMDGSWRMILVCSGLDKPRDIVVLPTSALVDLFARFVCLLRPRVGSGALNRPTLPPGRMS